MRACRVLGWVALLVVACAGSVRADGGNRYDRSRELYQKGKTSYEAGRFQEAYDQFKSAYMLSQEPALLYNIASALQGLERPHDAAETLRAYVRLKPDDPDKPAIEQRITSLEEAQRVLDLDRRQQREQEAAQKAAAAAAQKAAAAEKAAAEKAAPSSSEPTTTNASPATAALTSPELARARLVRNAGIGVAAGGVAIVVGGVVTGILARKAADQVSAESRDGTRFDPALERQGKTDDLVAGVLYGVGAAAVVAGTALAVVGWRKSRHAATATVTPAIAPGRVAAALTVTF